MSEEATGSNDLKVSKFRFFCLRTDTRASLQAFRCFGLLETKGAPVGTT